MWDRLQDPETWRRIGGIDEIWDADADGAGHLLGFKWRANAASRRIVGTARTTEMANPRLMIMALETGEMTGGITAEISPEQGATRLDVTLDFTSRGMIASLFFPLISTVLGEGLERQVDEFGASF